MGLREVDFHKGEWSPVEGLPLCGNKFEILVSHGFCDFEQAQISHTLRLANSLLPNPIFAWKCVSETAGTIRSINEVSIEAQPMSDGDAHTMIVLGGATCMSHAWMRHVRLMQRRGFPVVLLSGAATSYIKNTVNAGRVTTHWHDAQQLAEAGYHPNLTNRFSEKSNGIITAAGGAATAELMIGLIAPFLTSAQVAELGNRLLMNTIRKSDAEQPKNLADNVSLFDDQITQAIRVMEENIAEPMQITVLAEYVGISTRHLERAFRTALSDTPARFYKRMRAKRAKAMIDETLMPLIEIAVATGFGSIGSMSRAVREQYGLSPTKMRDRKRISLLAFVD